MTSMKKQIPLIITAVIILIAIFFVYPWMPEIILKGRVTTDSSTVNNTPETNRTNYDLQFFPPEIREDILNHAKKYSVNVSHWGFDPLNNEINIYAYGIDNESTTNDLKGQQIGNYTIHIINGSEILNAQDEVIQQLSQLRENPKYQIAHISMVTDPFSDPKGYYAELWCYSSTPENKELDNMVIRGWKIQVYPVSPIPSNTGNSSKSR